MYLELTPEDTIKDLQNLLIAAIPGFEFPRQNLFDYSINVIEMSQEDLVDDDFVLGVIWGDELSEESVSESQVLVDRSCFNVSLTSEEVNILALLMKQGWVQRQVTSIEHTRMKYTSSDFKSTSQANHLSKLLALLKECQRESLHMQRLYKRRKLTNEGYKSNWSCLRGSNNGN